MNKDAEDKANLLATLLAAARTGDHAGMIAALQAGANVNGKCPSSNARALHFAAAAGHMPILQSLVQSSRAKLDARDREDARALHWAARAGEVECVRALLAAGASVSTVTTSGATALHWAEAGQTGAAVALVLAGASLRAVDKAGRTALQVAPAETQQAMTQAARQRGC